MLCKGKLHISILMESTIFIQWVYMFCEVVCLIRPCTALTSWSASVMSVSKVLAVCYYYSIVHFMSDDFDKHLPPVGM